MELVSSSRQHAQNVTWCPGRDLVGLVLGDSDVAAARLNAATVWRSTHASVVAAVCWKGRDGRLLACARSLSRTAPVAVVSILDAETGVRVAGAHLQPPAMSRHPLIHLFWPAASIPRNTIPARIRALRDSAIISSLPPAVIPAEPGSSPASPLDLFDRIVGSTSSQDVLIAVRRDGTVEFSLWGLFYIGSFRLTLKDNDFKEVSVLQSINTDSLDSIIFLLEVATSKEISPKRKECFVATIDTGRVFIAHGSQLCSIAYHALKLNHLVSDLEILMGFVEREYDGFNDVSRKQVQNLKEAFMRQDEMKTPLESLRFLLATGNASPALESYLCGHSLGERGLRKWKTSFTNGFTHIESCVYSGVIPLIERIIAHLTELLGYCRIGGKYTKLGLSESPVTVCIEWVLKFAKEIQAVCQSLNRDLEAHAEFFVWLTFAIESVSTLDRSEELPTPQFDVSRILFSLERLFADEIDDEDDYTENQNICLSFFNKNRTRSSRTSCKNVTTTLKSSLTAMFEGVSLAVGGLFAMSNSDKVAELAENSGARDFDLGCGPLASVTIIEELLYSAVLDPDEQSVIIKRQDIRSGQKWPDIFVNLNTLLRMQQYSLENMAFTAISFLGPDLVVAVAESEAKQSMLVQVDVAKSFSSNQTQISCHLELQSGLVPVRIWTNPTQRVVSVGCDNDTFLVLTAP